MLQAEGITGLRDTVLWRGFCGYTLHRKSATARAMQRALSLPTPTDVAKLAQVAFVPSVGVDLQVSDEIVWDLQLLTSNRQRVARGSVRCC